MFLLPALGIKAVGGFLGARASSQQAAVNFQIDQANASIRRDSSLAMAAINGVRNRASLNIAELNYQMAGIDTAFRRRNAERLEQFAEARTKEGREMMRRQRRSFDAFQSTQVTQAAASGVEVGSGSVMDVLTETAAQIGIAMADMANAIGDERTNNFNEAIVERFRAGNDHISALAEMQGARSGFRVGEAVNRIAVRQADVQFGIDSASAYARQASGKDRSIGQALSTGGMIFAGVGQGVSNYKAMN